MVRVKANKQVLTVDRITEDNGVSCSNFKAYCRTELEPYGDGWINGYKWGEEYENNGKKPDLPHDVKVQIDGNGGEWLPPRKSGSNMWGITNKFRIVDNRYKPVTEQPAEPKQDDWFARGELPPVGWKGEYKPFWHACEVVAHHKGFAVVWDAHDLSYFRTNKPEIFRPIKTEREKFIEAVVGKNFGGYIVTKAAAEDMYDAGFKTPEDK